MHAKSGAGFTLIEVLVTVAIFSVTAALAVDLFVIFVQQQRRTINQQELQNDARSVIEQIAKDVREGSIDYAYYVSNFSTDQDKLFTSLNGTNDDCLVLRDALNAQIRYRLSGATIQRVVPTTPDNTLCSAVSGWEDVSPSTETVNSFTFFISPSEDPFAAQSALLCGTPIAPNDSICRWGTTCKVPLTTTCVNERNGSCYCYPQKYSSITPLHPRVTFSLKLSRVSNQQTLSQIFQTTVASRVFKNLDRLNSYVP